MPNIVSMTHDELLALPVSFSIETAGRAFGMGRQKASELVRKGEFPCPVLRIGNRSIVLRSALLDAVGIHEEAAQSDVDPASRRQPEKTLPVVAELPPSYVIVAVPVAATQLQGLLTTLADGPIGGLSPG